MLLLRIVGVAMTALVLSLVFKRHSPITALAVAASGGMVMLLMLWEPLAELLKALEYLAGQAEMPGGYLTLIVKAIGITLLCEIAASLCREAGEQGLAAKVYFAGRIIMLSLAMPVLLSVLEMIKKWVAL